MNTKTYRDYNRLLRNQCYLAMAIEKMATTLAGANCEAAQLCRQMLTEVDEFERNSQPIEGPTST